MLVERLTVSIQTVGLFFFAVSHDMIIVGVLIKGCQVGNYFTFCKAFAHIPFFNNRVGSIRDASFQF